MLKRIVKAYEIPDEPSLFELSMHPERVIIGIGEVRRRLCLFAEQPDRLSDTEVAIFQFQVVPCQESFERPHNAELLGSFPNFGNTYFLYGVKHAT